jgi:hypothetical protein
MNETIKIISEYGVLIVIAAAFVWSSLVQGKKTEKVLSELLTSLVELRATEQSQNPALENLRQTCETLINNQNILLSTQNLHTQLLERHDKRAEDMGIEVREVVTMLRTRPCVQKEQ